MSKNPKQRAKQLAIKGKTAEQIQNRTGVTAQQAERYVTKQTEAAAAAPTEEKKPKPLPNATPGYGINKQIAAQNNYDTQTALRAYADAQNTAGTKLGDAAFADHFQRDLTPEEQRYMYDYAGTKGYGIGDTFAAQYKDNAAFVDNGDPAKPFKPGTLKAAMVDGGIGRKEIMAAVKKKAKEAGEGFNKDAAYMRIADRWSNKGGALKIGALKDYQSKYEDKNPYLSAFAKASADGFSTQGPNGSKRTFFDYGSMLDDKRGSRHKLYTSAYNATKDGAYAKGDAFTRLKNSDLRAGQRVANTDYMSKFTGGFDKLGINNPTDTTLPGTDAGAGVDTGTGTGDGIGTDTGTGTTNPAFMTGGTGDRGENKTASVRTNKSSWKSSGKNRKGTNNMKINRKTSYGGL